MVGKAAGYDPLAASSARVVPFGMAVAEAVGVAAARAAEAEVSPHAFARNAKRIAWLRQRLEERGAYLPKVAARPPVGPYTHPYYGAYRFLLSRGLAVGGYSNDPKLDEEMLTVSYVSLLSNVAKRFLEDAQLGAHLLTTFPNLSGPLTPERALDITVEAVCEVTQNVCLEPVWRMLERHGLAPEAFSPGEVLTRGEMYALAARIAQLGREISVPSRRAERNPAR